MSKVKIFIEDDIHEGTWEDIDEDLLDMSEHDADVRSEVIEEVMDYCTRLIEAKKVVMAEASCDEIMKIARSGIIAVQMVMERIERMEDE